MASYMSVLENFESHALILYQHRPLAYMSDFLKLVKDEKTLPTKKPPKTDDIFHKTVQFIYLIYG